MGKESGDSKHFCPIMRCRVNLSLDIDNLSFHNKTMPFEGPTASKYWKEKKLKCSRIFGGAQRECGFRKILSYKVMHEESKF